MLIFNSPCAPAKGVGWETAARVQISLTPPTKAMVNRKISHGFWFYREKYAKQNPTGTRIGLAGSVEIWHAEIAASAARRRTQRQAVGPTTRKGGDHAFYIDFPHRSQDCYAEFSGKKQ